ncbi:nitrate- and nitrite sensing domain-containing protein [Kitasatospora sp. NPDC056138]|uniref:sensor histidine kinase n=1 Tax=Kitasatospora sp. NPDC056138 TaxID=3345724 RepID=UPI0035DECE1B
MAGPHQAAPITAPGDQAVSGGTEPEQTGSSNGAPEGEEATEKRRSRLRGTLNRRRATGISRFAMRNWRIRTRLIALLLLPVVVSIVLGGLRVQSSVQNSKQLSQMTSLSDLAQKATALANALQTERDISAGPLTTNNNQQDPEVINARKTTDTLSKAFATSADNFDNLDLAGGKALLLQVRKDLNQLSEARSTAYTNWDNIQATITNYDVIIKDLLSITQDIAIASNSTELVKVTRALQQFSLAKEAASMQRALISAALARPGGQDLSTSDETFGIRLQTAEDNANTNFTAIYGDAAATALRAPLTYNQVIAEAERYTKAVLNTNGIKQGDTRTYKDWYDSATAKITAEQKIESSLLDVLDGKAQQLQDDADTETLINSALIALVLIVSIAGAAIVARSMVRSLTRLQSAAEDVAERRLPELVKTLSESDPQDVDISIAPVGVDSADEIGHVAHAFDMVHSEAVRLAAEQALLRGNINAMFTNLSRRSQGLIQRQLSLISELESREADPDQLASLFKLDHLATRMRRNGENLLVLAGEDPGRRWTRPVPLVDVLRAAASEVEQYERIELAAVPSAEVAGRVVNDLVHLLAELLENATSFSSPQTRVRVTGHALPDGRVLVEIHDTGIGLSPDDLADINERLASPPTVDVSVSRRMGLFVVGRLSLRHGIRIQLRPSDSGGTTALVMLPIDVTNTGDRPGGRPGTAQAKQQRGVGPAPRQGRAGAAEALSGRQAAALGQGPSGGAPTGRPQLGQGPQAGGRPGAPGAPGGAPLGGPNGLPTRDPKATLPGGPNGGQPGGGQPNPGRPNPGQPGGGPAGAPNGLPTRDPKPAQTGGPGGGLPTRSVGQSLRENPAAGQPPRRTPGASGAPGGPGGGLPRRGGEGQPGAGRPGPAQERPRPNPEQPQHGRAEQPADNRLPGRPARGEQGRPGQELPTRRPQGGPAQPQQAQQAQQQQAGPAQQGPQVAPQPQAPQASAPAPAPAPAPGQAPAETTAQFARPRFEASQIDPRDPLGLGLVEPVLPSVPNPAAPQAPSAPQPPFQQLPGQSQAPAIQPPQPGLPAAGQERPVPQRQQPMALPTGPGIEGPQGGTGDGSPFQQQPVGGPQGRPRPTYQPQRPGTSAPGVPADQAPQQQAQQPQQQQRPQAPQGRAPQQQPQQPPQQRPEQERRRPAAQDPFAPQPGRPGPAAGQPGQPGQMGQMPGQTGQMPGQTGQSGQPSDAPWRPSANDERWRRAEQVRQPSTSGMTLSGLPRRTPQANLVSGTAESAPLTGPQVSRAPEEVRGRLTNLRRGIQQGRQAGAGTGTTPAAGTPIPGAPGAGAPGGNPGGADSQGRRPTRPQRFDGFDAPRGNGGFGEFGPDHQER